MYVDLPADTGNNALRRIYKGVVYTLAGGTSAQDEGSAGFVDGASEHARFRKPTSVLFDSEESLLVIDSGNHCVRVVSPDWSEVRTVAGGPRPGMADGPVDKCLLNYPDAGCLASDGAVLLADRDNNKIRRLSSSMDHVATLAGTGEWGAADGFSESCMYESLCVLASHPAHPRHCFRPHVQPPPPAACR